MEVDSAAALETGGRWDGDVNGAVEGFQEPPKDGSGAVTHHRALSTSENRRHEAAVETQAAVTYGVDALVDSV